MNKVHALLRAVLDELSRGEEGVEWIMSVNPSLLVEPG